MTKKKKSSPKDPRGKKLDWDKVEAIRNQHAKGQTVIEAVKEFGVCARTIRNVVAQRTWKGKRPGPLKGRSSNRTPGNATVVPSRPGKSWDAKVRHARETGHRVGSLSIDNYNRAYRAYVDKQSPTHVAKTVGIPKATASRYIEKGDPARGLKPLKDRFQAAMAKEQAREDYTLEKQRGETQRIARAFMGMVAERIKLMNPVEVGPDSIPNAVKKLQEVLERTQGVADQTVAVTAVDRFATWTVEEMKLYAQTGEVPEHDLMIQQVKKK